LSAKRHDRAPIFDVVEICCRGANAVTAVHFIARQLVRKNVSSKSALRETNPNRPQNCLVLMVIPLSLRCPLWVKSRHVHCKKACPLSPQKRPQKRISAQGQVGFTPESGHVQCTSDVCFGPKADMQRHQYISADSGCCNGRDRRSPPLNLDCRRRSTPHPPSRDTETLSRRWLRPTSSCL
jgi:hypothetical protein